MNLNISTKKANQKIIVRVLGGLGNQFFIYAFARSVSIKYKIPVFLETRTGFIKDSYKRRYGLKKYNIQLNDCSWFESLYYPIHKRFRRLTKIIYGNATYFTEQDLDHISINEISIKSGKVFLDGYWQKKEYFEINKDIIKNELSFKMSISQENLYFAYKMKNCNSVAVHLRRVKYDNLLEFGYYVNAINEIKSQVNSPVFYVFSDDILWCKENFKNYDDVFFMEHNKSDEISELWLFSHCKHFIIANSTFSWWGAWLSSYPEKIVIKPSD